MGWVGCLLPSRSEARPVETRQYPSQPVDDAEVLRVLRAVARRESGAIRGDVEVGSIPPDAGTDETQRGAAVPSLTATPDPSVIDVPVDMGDLGSYVISVKLIDKTPRGVSPQPAALITQRLLKAMQMLHQSPSDRRVPASKAAKLAARSRLTSSVDE